MGMKNHELVPAPLVVQLSNVRCGGVHKKLMDLCKHRLCCYERGKHYDGYRLTNRGYDYLSIKVLTSRDVLQGMGSQIGVGKEADIYVVSDKEGDQYCMKVHRLGRTSFRKLKEKRDYHGSRGKAPWIYLSRLSATKEYAFMTALHEHGFPVPRPVDFNRHIIVMELVDGFPLNQLRELADPGQLYHDLMELIVNLANNGVIHSDFNEFNILVDTNDKPVLIDFPQMVSTDHENADMYFDRDVNCVVEFFKRRFNYESELKPDFKTDVVREGELDREVKSSGYSKEIKLFDMECREEEMFNSSTTPLTEVDHDSIEHEEDLTPTLCAKCSKDCEIDGCSCGDDVDVVGISDELNKCENSSLGSSEAKKILSFEDSAVNLHLDRPTTCNSKHKEVCSNKIECDFEALKIESESAHCQDTSDNFEEECQQGDESSRNDHNKEDRSPSPARSVISKCLSSKSRTLSPASRLSLLAEMAAMRERRMKGQTEDTFSLFDVAFEFRNDRGRALSHVSGSTSASTISPEEIKKRTKEDILRSISKQRRSKKSMRVKGEANAYNRLKKDNMYEIKESVDWDEY